MSQHAHTVREIVAALGGELIGDADSVVVQVAPLERAGASEIGFVAQPKYRKSLEATQAGVVILPPVLSDAWSGTRIIADDPYLYFARVSQLLNPEFTPAAGVHGSAVVLSEVPASVSVGPHAFVDEGCAIGEGAVIGAGVVVERGCSIGAGTRLHARAVIKHGCSIGARGIVHSGAVIGSDGFGIAKRSDGSWEKIPQIGRVRIGDDVEIGANTCIDRGALDDTIIENGVKLDNLIQIAHNCHVGEHTAMAAMAGIAGSARIGKRVLIGGAAVVAGHTELADDIVIGAHSGVSKSLSERGVYTAAFAAQPHAEWARNVAHFRHLDEMASRIKALEKKLEELESKS